MVKEPKLKIMGPQTLDKAVYIFREVAQDKLIYELKNYPLGTYSIGTLYTIHLYKKNTLKNQTLHTHIEILFGTISQVYKNRTK